MANRLTHKRRKCVKSANIFRDKQEYSSLYTISSRSASSIRSTEMSSQITKQNTNSNQMYRDQQQGDSLTNVKSSQNKNKYPKLPTDISRELQQKVYSGSYKAYYSDRAQFIKNKFDHLTLQTKSPCPKPCCPVHIPANKYSQPYQYDDQMQPRRCYPINRLEESYWARWKPNKCEEMDTWQKYMEQASYNRRPRCNPNSMMYDCMKMLPMTTKKYSPPPKKCQPIRRCVEEKPLEIIREPTEIRDSNSSEIDTSHKTNEKKSKLIYSCCPCRDISKSDSIISKSDDCDEEFKKGQVIERKQTHLQQTDEIGEITHCNGLEGEDEQIVNPDQEDYESLYNEMFYENYENDLMNTQYEVEKEETEKYEQTDSEHHEEMKNYERWQDRKYTDMEEYGSPQMDHYKHNREYIETAHTENEDYSHYDRRRMKEFESYEQDRIYSKERPIEEDLQYRKYETSEYKEEETYDKDAKQTTSNNKNADEKYKRNFVKEGHKSIDQISLRGEAEAEQKQSWYRMEYELYVEPPGNTKEPTEKNSNEEERNQEITNIESKINTGKEKEINELVVNPHLSTSNEYSEPEIAVLKHTDSFIINSRRQKEDNKPRKPQPKFIKLTKQMTPAFTPSVKPHSYPLKPALKKERQPSQQPIIGFSRPISPASPKMRTASKQFVPTYLLRH